MTNYPQIILDIDKDMHQDLTFSKVSLMNTYQAGWVFCKKETLQLIRQQKKTFAGNIDPEKLIYELERMFFKDAVR